MENDNKIDLFDNPEILPQVVKDIIERYELTRDDSDGYRACAFFILELEKVGYTCEYGLDAEPYNLRKIVLTEDNISKALENPELMLLGILNGELTVEGCRLSILNELKEIEK